MLVALAEWLDEALPETLVEWLVEAVPVVLAETELIGEVTPEAVKLPVLAEREV